MPARGQRGRPRAGRAAARWRARSRSRCPPGITPSGTPSRPASSATAATVPSPPATTSRSGARRGRALQLARARSRTRRTSAVHRPDERLGIEPAARRPGWRSARSARRPRLDSAADVRPHRPHRRRRRRPRRRGRAPRRATYGMPRRASRDRDRAGRRGGPARRRREPRRAAAPARPTTRRSGRFLAKRGPGLHHVAYQVADIDAALAQLRDQGVRLIDEAPRIGIRGSRVAFLHPAASALGAHRARRTSYVPRMTARRAAIGFQGGQVLSLRISEEKLTELRQALAQKQRRRLAGGRGDRRRRGAGPRPGGVPARPVRRAPRRVLSLPSPFFFFFLSLSPYLVCARPPRPRRRARPRSLPAGAQRRPDARQRAARCARYSRLGEHGALWLATGRAGMALDTRDDAAAGRARPRRASATAYLHLDDDQARRRAQAARRSRTSRT